MFGLPLCLPPGLLSWASGTQHSQLPVLGARRPGQASAPNQPSVNPKRKKKVFLCMRILHARQCNTAGLQQPPHLLRRGSGKGSGNPVRGSDREDCRTIVQASTARPLSFQGNYLHKTEPRRVAHRIFSMLGHWPLLFAISGSGPASAAERPARMGRGNSRQGV